MDTIAAQVAQAEETKKQVGNVIAETVKGGLGMYTHTLRVHRLFLVLSFIHGAANNFK